MVQKNLKERSLEYHSRKPAGKLAIAVTKPAKTPEDLTLAYSPGVAEPVLAIAKKPLSVYDYTSKGNLVGIISNGSAILGLGNLGAMASKPVMEGKAVLFKRFGNIDAFDLEVDEKDPEKFVEIVRTLAPTFGGINLEDIKAPDCFYIEEKLQELCDIPIFHDDQHGTAIVTLAALINAIKLQGKKWKNLKIVCIGAGAAALATLDLLMEYGTDTDNIRLIDSRGVVYKGRPDNSGRKNKYAAKTKDRNLEDACKGADVILGFAKGNILPIDNVKSMAAKPIVFACANPDPEIKPELVDIGCPDSIIATGRSDYPNQVNNVLAFPYIFRGALDTRASAINLQMKIACAEAISTLATTKVPEGIKKLYKSEQKLPGGLEFGKYYILPKPMDPRLLEVAAGAVAKAAIKTKVARIK
ncbi:MAG: malate dehydrogenase [Gammaproteobacteria bacterium]|nr:malate dehydrogenase [Gammaproteobacteria bacterium]